jgi:phage tail protein X
MEFQQYVTSENDTWDNIAYKAYGNPNLIEGIISANPNVGITDVLAGGVVLSIPIIEEEQTVTNLENLPPWKR